MANVQRITYVHPDGGYDLALVVRDSPWDGRRATFYSHDKDSLQVGRLVWGQGHSVPPHYHHEQERRTTGTHEVLLVEFGLIAVDLYLHDKSLFRSVELKTRDLIVIFGGVHGVRSLVPSEVLEIKQGPYLGRDADKREV